MKFMKFRRASCLNWLKNLETIPINCTEAHVQTPRYGQYLERAHNHITPAVAAMDSCFARIGAHGCAHAYGTGHTDRGVDTCSSMQLIGIVSNLFGHTGQFFWYHLHTHAVRELFCSSQSTATTCLWWSWRLKQRLHSPRQWTGLWYASYLLLVDPSALPSWWAPMRANQRSIAATARVIWLCACIKYWP